MNRRPEPADFLAAAAVAILAWVVIQLLFVGVVR